MKFLMVYLLTLYLAKEFFTVQNLYKFHNKQMRLQEAA